MQMSSTRRAESTRCLPMRLNSFACAFECSHFRAAETLMLSHDRLLQGCTWYAFRTVMGHVSTSKEGASPRWKRRRRLMICRSRSVRGEASQSQSTPHGSTATLRDEVKFAQLELYREGLCMYGASKRSVAQNGLGEIGELPEVRRVARA
jgi:hypothetical protein